MNDIYQKVIKIINSLVLNNIICNIIYNGLFFIYFSGDDTIIETIMYEKYFQNYKIFIYYMIPNNNYTITNSTELQQFYFQSSHQIKPKFIRKISIASLQTSKRIWLQQKNIVLTIIIL